MGVEAIRYVSALIAETAYALALGAIHSHKPKSKGKAVPGSWLGNAVSKDSSKLVVFHYPSQ